MECLQNAEFVLDKYHKNKAIKAMTAGIENKYRNNNDKEIRDALNEENLELYEQLTDSLIMQNPDRAETISQNAAYLQRFVKGIGICKKDERANNGGCNARFIPQFEKCADSMQNRLTGILTVLPKSVIIKLKFLKETHTVTKNSEDSETVFYIYFLICNKTKNKQPPRSNCLHSI